jgi:pimeloyl-ACP methyl ester carboxylesterase
MIRAKNMMRAKNRQMLVNREDVTFESAGVDCHAWLYRPLRGCGAPPVIVMANGLGAVKELRLDAYAEVFTQAGYACLVFDYRHFGASAGLPRELLSVRKQRQDWRAAVAYARGLKDVDTERIVLWGTSFAGAHAIVTAADDQQIAAVIVQCPFTDGLASVRAAGAVNGIRITARAVLDVGAMVLGLDPIRVKGAARPGEVALMAQPDDVDAVTTLLARSGFTEETYPNDIAARAAFGILLDRPGRRAAELSCPTMFCISDRDAVAPAEVTRAYASRVPFVEIHNYPAGHFEIYVDGWFDRISSDQLRFLCSHVPPHSGQTP